MKFPRLVGVIHLPPLAGSPGAVGLHPSQALQRAAQRVVTELRVFEKTGFDAVILENFGDLPFYKNRVPTETIATLSVLAVAAREISRLPLGLNVLRNDGLAALTVASIAGFDFIRVNVLCGVAATDQGWIEGEAAELQRKRLELDPKIQILADVQVKHACTVAPAGLELAVEEVALRAGADAVIATGSTTGREIHGDELKRASQAARSVKRPLYVGSGANSENIAEILSLANGVIVSSSLRKGGRAGAELDLKRVQAFVKAAQRKPTKKKPSKRKPNKKKPVRRKTR